MTSLPDVTPDYIRAYLVSLDRRGLKDTTQHAAARAIRAFCNFAVNEALISDSPMKRVKMPKRSQQPLPAFTADEVRRLLKACKDTRDTAMILVLLDSGCRAQEFLDLNVGDVDMKSGAVNVRLGKGRKSRTTFIGSKARKALNKYLSQRNVEPDDPLWVSETSGERLTLSGLTIACRKLGERSGVENCHPHTFRRSFALWSLRSGMDVFSLQRLMGHADLTVLRQYLAQVEADLQEAHKRHGAVDNML